MTPTGADIQGHSEADVRLEDKAIRKKTDSIETLRGFLAACFSIAIFGLSVAGCSGGSSPSSPPTSIATASPSPPAQSPSPAAPSITGQIVTFGSTSPIVGATIYVSHGLISGATAPPAAPEDGGVATTSPSGTYEMSLPPQYAYPSTFYVEVFKSGLVTAHEELNVTGPSQNTIRAIGLTSLSTDEANWITLLNSDRAKWGAAPVVADEASEEIARLWVAWLGQGHYEHSCASTDQGCPDKAAYASAEDADFSLEGENLDAAPINYVDAEEAFMAEAANCPQPTNPSTCPFADNTGHFLNIVNPGVSWIGVAEDLDGLSYDGGGTTPYYDEEFTNANRSGASVMRKSKSP